MKTLKTLALATAVSAGLLGSNTVSAASQGNIGETSFGDFQIFLNKDIQVAVWGFKDLFFTEDNGAIPAGSEVVPICVSNSEAADAQVRFMVESTTTDFTLKNGAVVGGSYTVKIEDKTTASTNGEWGAGKLPSSSFSPVAFESDIAAPIGGATLCNENLDNHTVNMTVNVTPDANAAAGIYTDTVTVTVAPI